MINNKDLPEKFMEFISTKEVKSLLQCAYLVFEYDDLSVTPTFTIKKSISGNYFFEAHGAESNGNTAYIKQYYYFKDENGVIRTNTDLK